MLLQNKPAVKKDGTTKAAIFSFRKLTLAPATVTATGLLPVPTSDKIVLSLAAKLPMGGKLVPQTSLLFPIQGELLSFGVLACQVGGPFQLHWGPIPESSPTTWKHGLEIA
jgi:hypothetical protein